MIIIMMMPTISTMLMQMMMAMILIIMIMILIIMIMILIIIINNTENGRKEKDLWSGHILGKVLKSWLICIYIYAKYRGIYSKVAFILLHFLGQGVTNLSLTNERQRTSGIIIEYLVPDTLTCSFLLKSMP